MYSKPCNVKLYDWMIWSAVFFMLSLLVSFDRGNLGSYSINLISFDSLCAEEHISSSC